VRVAILVLLLSASTASAYPIFQFSSGSDRCSDCHFSPVGGGLPNAFGRSELTDTIAWKGDGNFLHGAWTPPDVFAIGGDFRFAGLASDQGMDDRELTAFPMQADLHARVEAGPIAIAGTVGLNGAVRERPDKPTIGDYVVSREHYVMYQDGAPYVRAGRFFPMLGVRTADHTALERRALDMYLLEEPYALGAGTSGDNYELHASLFVANPFGAGPQPSGVTAYYERFIGKASLAGQARYAKTDDDARYLGGAVAKKWLPSAKVLLQGEVDVQLQRVPAADTSQLQLLAYAGITRVMRGLAIGAVAQYWNRRASTELNVQLFPLAHFELHLLGRLAFGELGSPDSLALLQVHYFL
jgi:hypothetical protein